MSLLNLPQEAFNGICTFIDDKSLLRLREVSKAAMEIIDGSYIVSTRQTLVRYFSVTRSMDNTHFAFNYDTIRNYSIWKIRFAALFKMFEVTERRFVDNRYFITATISSAKLLKFLNHLKSDAKRTEFYKFVLVTCYEKARHIIDFLSDFFEGIYINNVNFYNVPGNHVSIVNFVRKNKPQHLICRITSLRDIDSRYYILRLADMVESISIVECNEWNSFNEIMAFIRDLMKSKCSIFHFLPNRYTFSNVETEKLLQILHQTDKKIQIDAKARAPPITFQIGVYKVHIRDRGSLSINHLDL